MKCLFVDVETGGLDCKVHALLSIGAVVFDPVTGDIGMRYESDVMPHEGKSFTLEALGVNGFTVERMKSARPAREVYQEFRDWIWDRDALTLWAHNAEFDAGFLREFERLNIGVTLPVFHHRNGIHCSKQLLGIAKLQGHYPTERSCSLMPACEHFGIPCGNHTAFSDTLAGARLVCKLWQLFGWAK